MEPGVTHFLHPDTLYPIFPHIINYQGLLTSPLGFPQIYCFSPSSLLLLYLNHHHHTLCDLIDSSPPGSAVPGILQARTLEWVAISFSNAWKWKVQVKSLSRVWLLATPWTAAHQAPPSMGFSWQEYWCGCHCLPILAPVKMQISFRLRSVSCPLAHLWTFVLSGYKQCHISSSTTTH